jgi:alkylation response protein AidB-like acyl-CoA dehydrogenase
MVTFALTDEQRLLADNLSRLLSETHGFEATHRASEPAASSELWRALAELGVIGAALDESHGGFAGDARTIAVVMAELGSSLVFEPFLETAVIAGRLLQQWTDDAARRTALDAIISGESIVIVAHSPTGNPSAPTRVAAVQTGTGVVLSGTVSCIRHAQRAQSFLVPAVARDGSTRVYEVPSNCPGLLLETYRLIDGAGGADLQFREVEIPASSHMEFAADTRTVIDDAFEWGTLASVAEAAGIIEALNSATFSYLMTRKQFGALIGSFQALQHRAADMHIAAEEMLAIADATIESFGSGPSPTRSALVSAAKVIADSASRRVGGDAVQLHGGMGVSDELIISHYARRLIALRCVQGGADAHRLRFRSLQ